MKFFKKNAISIIALLYLAVKLYKDYKKPFNDPDNSFIIYLIIFVPLLIFLILIYFKYYHNSKSDNDI